MSFLDGEHKMSKWPKDVRDYVISNPKKEILVCQSVRSKHELMRARVVGRAVCISYNSRLNCFVAWNVVPNLENVEKGEKVRFELRAGNQKLYTANPVLTVFDEPVYNPSKTVKHQKVCVFPVDDFTVFYNDYETYMTQKTTDLLNISK